MAQVLVVEEDRRQFVQIKDCLQSKGHKAWRAGNSAEALDLLAQYNFDVILAPVNLEGSDVFDFLRQVKASSRLKEIAFVFCCTEKERCEQYATDDIVQAGQALGACKYILLPEFDANRLWEQLEKCFPSNAQKNDSLGGEVTTYSLNSVAWTAGLTPKSRRN